MGSRAIGDGQLWREVVVYREGSRGLLGGKSNEKHQAMPVLLALCLEKT